MNETPAAFNASAPAGLRPYPGDDLSGFRWHTGASLRPWAAGETCPVLFRDVGPAALATFLRGRLRRLAGPLSPLVYLRTVDYSEPYIDHERTGRLALVRPLLLHPWHAGVAATSASPAPFLAWMAAASASCRETFHWHALPNCSATRPTSGSCEVLGGRAHDEAVAESLHALDRLGEELEASEILAAPLRRALQSAARRPREQARSEMDRLGLTESDLCTAWHHLPRGAARLDRGSPAPA